jgi:hypothetical protein
MHTKSIFRYQIFLIFATSIAFYWCWILIENILKWGWETVCGKHWGKIRLQHKHLIFRLVRIRISEHRKACSLRRLRAVSMTMVYGMESRTWEKGLCSPRVWSGFWDLGFPRFKFSAGTWAQPIWRERESLISLLPVSSSLIPSAAGFQQVLLFRSWGLGYNYNSEFTINFYSHFLFLLFLFLLTSALQA